MEKNKYALHEYCDNAIEQTKIFNQYARVVGYEIIPGRYGGEFNNDMLAIGQRNDRTVLTLGLKILDSDASFVVDSMSLGPHKQFSAAWLNVLCFSLRQSDETSYFSDAIEFARESNTLSLEFVFVDPSTHFFTTVGVSVE